MSENVDFKKVITILNNELDSKYNNSDFGIELPEFEYKENRHYFSYSKDSYNNHLVTFLKYHVYIGGMYASNENSEAKVIKLCKEWFNKYLDTIIQLKF